MINTVSFLSIGKVNTIKRLTEREGKCVVEVVSEQGTQVQTNIKFGHRASAKRLSVAEKPDQQHVDEKWFPRVEVNGELVYIKDEDVPEGIASFESRYLALNFARRYLAKKHKVKALAVAKL
jgi:hypothetical protein